ncbi:MAG: dienelactone hydrolase [Planctomycetota bacterium]
MPAHYDVPVLLSLRCRLPHTRTPLALLAGILWLTAGSALGQTWPDLEQSPRPAGSQGASISADDQDVWRSLGSSSLSRNGRWAAWEVRIADGRGGWLQIEDLESGARQRVARGSGARFDASGRYLACRVQPTRDAKRAHELAEREEPSEEVPKPTDRLVLVDLDAGTWFEAADLKDFQLPEEGGDWFAYRVQEDPWKDKEKDKDKDDAKRKSKLSDSERKRDKRKRDKGLTLVLQNFLSSQRHRLENVSEYRFSPDGAWLAWTTSTKADGGDGVWLWQLGVGDPMALLEGEGDARKLAFDEDSGHLAFLSNSADWMAPAPAWILYHTALNAQPSARPMAALGSPGLPAGWCPSPNRTPHFSRGAERLLFGSAAAPEEDPEPPFADEKVTLDLWNWRDTRLQPQQLVQLGADRERTHLAAVPLDQSAAAVVQLGSPDLPSIRLGDHDRSAYALGVSDLPYRRASSWKPDQPRDLVAVHVQSGARRKLGSHARAGLSSGGQFVTWWDPDARTWFAQALDSADDRGPVDLGSSIPHGLWDPLMDRPQASQPYGLGAWLGGDLALLVYDQFDVWVVDPTGAAAAWCLTAGEGRARGVRLRGLRLDPKEPALDPTEPLLLSAIDLGGVNTGSRDSGFWRASFLERGLPEILHMGPERLGRPTRAAEAERLLFTRESYRVSPDLWASDNDVRAPRQLSASNPQVADFAWGSVDLMRWTGTDGQALEGLLYKPDDWDQSKRYPLLVYFYERNSDNLHRHNAPIPSRSTVRYASYLSRGYMIFVPDIPYRVGYPGQSCEHAVLPGITSLIDAGLVDPARIGVQGHSWGGYQIAHLVTRTEMFAAAVAGAPVSNMTSAYGGIRWASGMSRMFQYEATQSRIGGSLWEETPRYVENSPIFFADEVHTPLVILHNDKDGAVPWYQGIELFVALRRLDREAWLFNYNNEGHGIGRYAHRRDYALRMGQFFDHYLLDAPAPAWMTHGIPALDKGREFGFEPATDEYQDKR